MGILCQLTVISVEHSKSFQMFKASMFTAIFLEYKHRTLTKPLLAYKNSGAFSETAEGALFLPGAKDERSPLV